MLAAGGPGHSALFSLFSLVGWLVGNGNLLLPVEDLTGWLFVCLLSLKLVTRWMKDFVIFFTWFVHFLRVA